MTVKRFPLTPEGINLPEKRKQNKQRNSQSRLESTPHVWRLVSLDFKYSSTNFDCLFASRLLMPLATRDLWIV